MENKKYPKNRIIRYLFIAVQLHSLAPNKEIKKLIEILTLCMLPITVLELMSGDKILGFIPTLKVQFIQDNGVFLLFGFIIIFCIIFFDVKKLKEITLKIQKQEKTRQTLNTQNTT
jgi:hypothetical protein